MHRAILKTPRHQSETLSSLHDQIKRKIFNKKFNFVFKRLLVQRVKNSVARTIGRGAGPHSNLLTVMCCHSPKGALIDFSFRRP